MKQPTITKQTVTAQIVGLLIFISGILGIVQILDGSLSAATLGVLVPVWFYVIAGLIDLASLACGVWILLMQKRGLQLYIAIIIISYLCGFISDIWSVFDLILPFAYICTLCMQYSKMSPKTSL